MRGGAGGGGEPGHAPSDRFPVPDSPGYHAFRHWYGWDPVPVERRLGIRLALDEIMLAGTVGRIAAAADSRPADPG